MVDDEYDRSRRIVSSSPFRTTVFGKTLIVKEVKNVLKSSLGENLQSEDVARMFFMSQRTFNRRLKSRGTNYRSIRDEVKMEVAALRLTECDWKVTDVAYELGYKCPSNFVKAFKRWSGLTPGRYKRSQEPLIKEQGRT